MRRQLLLLLHALTQLLVQAYDQPPAVFNRLLDDDDDDGGDYCKQALLSWLQTAGVASFLQPLPTDLDICLGARTGDDPSSVSRQQYCYIKRRIPLHLQADSPSKGDQGAYGRGAVDFNGSEEDDEEEAEEDTILASLSVGACLPSSCTTEQVTSIFNTMCNVHSCSSLATKAEVQLCTLTQALHCDPKARLNAPANADKSIYLHCASSEALPAYLAASPQRNNTLAITPIEAKALAACGTAYLRDWKLLFQSGTLQDLGDFDSCSDPSSDSNYCLVEYYGVLAAGRCVPKDCTAPLMEQFFQYMCRRVGSNGMAHGVDSTCLDYANVIPLDLCIVAQLLGCGHPFKLADMSSGEIDINLLVKELFHPQRRSIYDVTPTHKSMEYLGLVVEDLADTVAQVTNSVASVVDLTHNRRALLVQGQEEQEAVSYTVSCDLKPVPRQGRDWNITWCLLGCFFVALPTLGLLAYNNSDDLVLTSSTPTPILNQTINVPSFTIWQRIQFAVGTSPRLNSLLTCFSLPSNIEKAAAIRYRIQHGSFPHLDGLRSLSIVWIVVGHAFVFGMRPGVLHNLGGLSHIWDSFTFQAVYSAQFAVDTFFLISGMMLGAFGPQKVARLIGVDPRKNSSPPFTRLIAAWGKLVLQRFVRITGLYYFVMALSYYALQFCGFSPKWPSLLRLLRTGEKGGCQKYWWSLALLVNNIYPDEALTECFGHAWFLANDFQFFMVGSMLIILACCREKWFEILWWVILFVSLGFTWHTITTYDIRLPASYLSGMDPTIINGHKSLAAGLIASLTKFYSKPWCRIPPYLLGIYYGRLHTSGAIAKFLGLSAPQVAENGAAPSVEQYLRLGSPQSTSISMRSAHVETKSGDSVLATVTNIVVMGSMLFLVFIPYEANRADAPEWNRFFDACYMAFSRTVWALSLGWMICCLSYSNPKLMKKGGSWSYLRAPFTNVIFSFLSQPAFSYIGLVSYALYLIHLPIQEVYYASQRQAISITEGSGWFYGLSFAGVSLIAATLLYLCVELPLANVAATLGI